MSTPYGPPPSPWAGGSQPPSWGGGPPVGPTETEPKAIVALVLAVLAYTPTVPFIGAIAALVVASYAQRDIVVSGGRKSGLGMIKAARILAWVHLVLVGLVFLLFLLVFLPLGLFGLG